MGYLNLILAIFWLILGVGMLSGHVSLRVPIGEQSVSAGWLALALAAYNLFRWWGVRSRSLQRRAELEEDQRRAAELRARRASVPPPEPDPTFDFSGPSIVQKEEKRPGVGDG